MALPLPTLGFASGAGARFPLPTPAVVVVSCVAFLVVAAERVDFAFSTIFVSIPAAPPDGTGAVGFSGETGRARKDFAGDAGVGLIGERGMDLEFKFAERGERTCDSWRLAREVVRAGGSGGPRGRFLGFERSSFSLSRSISSLYFVSRAL